MAQIRQEINLINGLKTTTSASTQNANEYSQLDTTQYNGTVTYYLEAVIKSSSAGTNYTLTFDTASITQADQAITTSYALVRKAFTPTSGATSDNLTYASNGTATLSVLAARIVIIQSATTITNTETQIEVGNASNTTATVDTALTNPKYWKYTSANWDGTITAYFEGTFMSGTSKSAATLTLQTSTSITAPSWSNVASSAITTISTVATRVRSGAITLTDGNWYRVVMKAGNSKSGITVYNAKIVVQQVGATTTSTYYFDASDSGPTDASAVWVNEANAFDGSTATNATGSLTGSSQRLTAGGTTAPTSGNPITSVRGRIYAGATGGISFIVDILSSGVILASPSTPISLGWGGYSTLTPPSGGWSWSVINNLTCDGHINASASTTITLARIEIEVTHGDGVTGITKLEPQYLLANTLFAAGTSLQTFLTKWDSTEWSGVTNTYYFQAEAADNSTSDVELWEADGGGSGLGVLTNIDNAQISSAVTMPTSQDMDTKATTNAGDIAAARILVATVISTASCALTGTVTNDSEVDIVTGGSTIILTLTGDTFIAAGTGPIGSTANTQALIDGIVSAQSETNGWNNVVKPGIETADVVRTSDTVATITLDAEPTYNITANETITVTVPAAVLTGGAAIVASPTFTITATVTTVPGSLLMMGMGL